MKSLVLSLFLMPFVHSILAQDIDFQWAIQVGSGQSDYVKSVVSDDSGYVYVVGAFKGTVDFDPDTTSYFLTSKGGDDVFVEKLDESGQMVWAVSLGGIFNDDATSIFMDPKGALYIAGHFSGSVDFDPDSILNHTVTSKGNSDGFVLKLKNNGHFDWVKSFGGIQADKAYVVEMDPIGNILIAGDFKGTCDMDPDSAVYNLTASGASSDIFVVKLDTNASMTWAKSMGGLSNDVAYDMAIDASSNLYLTGTFFGSGDFDPDSQNVHTLNSNGGEDYYVLKMNQSGSLKWAYSFGKLSSDVAATIETNSQEVFIGGSFRGDVDFDPDTSSFILNAQGIANAFVQKLDTAGNFIWAGAFIGTNKSSVSSLHLGYSGNVYIAGSYAGTVDFDPDTSTYLLTSLSSGSTDIFIQNMDASGNMLYTIDYGSVTYDFAFDLTTNSNGHIITVGSFTSTVDFDPDTASSYNLTCSNWQYDGFVQQLKECLIDTMIDSVFTCQSSYTWVDSITYTQSTDTALFITQNFRGCDSIVMLKLTIQPEYGTDVVNTCAAYTWIDSITYTSNNNTARFTLSTANGCDSIVSLDLTINSIEVTDKISSCTPIIWIDSLTYTTSTNTPQVTFTNSAGCDSIVKLDLTITKPNINVLVSEPMLTSQANASIYQWLDCNDNFSPIQGAVGKTYTPRKNGLYAVEVEKNSCIDTSECVAITTIGLIETNSEFSINIYPNPSDGHFYIDLLNSKNISIKVFNAQGSLIEKLNNLQQGTHQLDIKGAKGLYIIEFTSETGIQRFELIKE